MALDQNQQQIREGAGLEEGRLNTEFIDALQKYGGVVALVICIIVGMYAGWNWLQRKETSAHDQAYAALADAQKSGSPVALLAVARDNASRKALAHMARLNAADAYLGSFRTGLIPGAELDQVTGEPKTASDTLTDEQRVANLKQAEDLYRAVGEEAAAKAEHVLHAIGGFSGLAAVAECRGDLDAARKAYERVITLAEGAGLSAPALTAKSRIESLSQIATTPRLYAKSELATLPPGEGVPGAAAPGGAPGMTRMELRDGKLVPATTPIPVPSPETPPIVVPPPENPPAEPDAGEPTAPSDPEP